MKELEFNSNFNVIREYVASDVNKTILNDLQQRLLRRWNYYINFKLAGELTTSAIVKRMMDEFGIERSTAFNDMGFAEALFGYSATMNKRFRIGARIDFLEEKIKFMYDEKEYDIASKLEHSLQRYYETYPDLKPDRGPRTINFNITKNDFNTEGLPSIEEALDLIKIAT